ncbi:MAG TPA: hypothetical protein VL362_03455 [Patescibacteria group bacterium]|nr:hypothetical protein [Patescibacteria group bacterium]
MKNDAGLSLGSIKNQLGHFLARYHVVLYTVIVVGGMAAAIFFVYQVIVQATSVSPTTSTSAPAFDQGTINKLESLNEKSGGGTPLELPNNQRINPFVN